jgi:hypothetical protein
VRFFARFFQNSSSFLIFIKITLWGVFHARKRLHALPNLFKDFPITCCGIARDGESDVGRAAHMDHGCTEINLEIQRKLGTCFAGIASEQVDLVDFDGIDICGCGEVKSNYCEFELCGSFRWLREDFVSLLSDKEICIVVFLDLWKHEVWVV